MGSTQCVVVSGPIPSAVAGMVRDRFEGVRISAAAARTVIECSIPDQAALRALLTELWDVGGTVVLVAVLSNGSERSRHDNPER